MRRTLIETDCRACHGDGGFESEFARHAAAVDPSTRFERCPCCHGRGYVWLRVRESDVEDECDSDSESDTDARAGSVGSDTDTAAIGQSVPPVQEPSITAHAADTRSEHPRPSSRSLSQ